MLDATSTVVQAQAARSDKEAAPTKAAASVTAALDCGQAAETFRRRAVEYECSRGLAQDTTGV